MNEGKLVKICLVGSILGIVALYFLTMNIYSLHVNIGDINRDWIGKTVNVTGEVVNLKESKGHVFFDLKDNTGRIKVVLWNNTLELLELKGIETGKIKNGVKANLIGNIQVYKGELEVIPVREQVNIID